MKTQVVVHQHGKPVQIIYAPKHHLLVRQQFLSNEVQDYDDAPDAVEDDEDKLKMMNDTFSDDNKIDVCKHCSVEIPPGLRPNFCGNCGGRLV